MLVRNGTRRRGDANTRCPGRCTRNRRRHAARHGRRSDRIRHHRLKKQMTSLPTVGALHATAPGRRRRGQLRPSASVSNNVNKPLVPGALTATARGRAPEQPLRSLVILALQMPGVRSQSPAPELRGMRTAIPATSSKVASGRARLAVTATAPANSKTKGPGDQENRGKNRRGRLLLPSARRGRSPMPQPPAVGPEVGRTRCSWITANSDPLYVAFHDEEWGVPVHDDQKLFELLTLAQALAELTWPAILSRREEFREMFDYFNYASLSELPEKKINLLRSSGSMLLSEQKIRAVVINAKQMHKVVQEFGSFSNYCWSFVNHRPITNSFRYARQVPTKTAKAEAISKDLMRRGFQYVGPTTIYSFMQVAGIVNDHLSCCFRFQACINVKNVRKEPALPARRLSSPTSEDSDTREM